MEEIWKDIPEWEGYYQASNLGRIKSLSRIRYAKGLYHYTSKELILKLSKTNGYQMVMLCKNGVQKTKGVHQLVAMSFLNHIPCGYDKVVNHINFNRSDNRLCNLEVITARENLNQKHLPSTSTHVGVHQRKRDNKWIASIFVDGKFKYIGCFDNEDDAGQAYQTVLACINENKEIPSFKKDRSSKYDGVSWNKNRRKWVAHIKINGKTKHLGVYKNEIDAHYAYEKALNEINNGKEVSFRPRENSSKHKGVSWHKRDKKWQTNILVGGKQTHIGFYDTEEEAIDACRKAQLAISKGQQIPIKRKSYTSKFKGVSWNSNRKKWAAQIKVGSTHYWLGMHDTEQEAYEARKKAELEHSNQKTSGFSL